MQAQTGSSRILLIEDDPHDAELVQLALTSFNLLHQLDLVTDGEAALHYLFHRDGLLLPPRLILLDLKLPKISGLRVLEAIRADPRTCALIVVVMTSSQELPDLTACYQLGVNSYVVKPLDFQQFIQITQQVGLYWMVLNQPPPLLSP